MFFFLDLASLDVKSKQDHQIEIVYSNAKSHSITNNIYRSSTQELRHELLTFPAADTVPKKLLVNSLMMQEDFSNES